MKIGFSLLDEVWNDGQQGNYLVFLNEQKDPTTSTDVAVRGYDLIQKYTKQKYPNEWPFESEDQALRRTFLAGYGYSMCNPLDWNTARVAKGIQCLEEAMTMGDGTAAKTLANLYTGEHPDVSVDTEKRLQLLVKAAELGNPTGSIELATYYSCHGSSDPTHPWLEKKWKKKIAQFGMDSVRNELNKYSSPLCNACDPTGTTFKRRKRCRMSLYCSSECQRVHWKAGHKEECPILCVDARSSERLRKSNKL